MAFRGFCIGESLFGRAYRDGIDEGTEEDERLWVAAESIDRRQCLFLGHGREEGKESATAGATDDDARGVDMERGRIEAKPADEVTSVLDGFERGSAIASMAARFGGDRECTARSKVEAMRDKLAWSWGIPEAAVEEYDCRCWGILRGSGRVDMSLLRTIFAFHVVVGGCVFEDFTIPRFTDWCDSFQLAAHNWL